MRTSTQQELSDFVARNVHYCASSVVHTLCGGYATFHNGAAAYEPGCRSAGELESLCEQAFELSCPIDDYEEAALQKGYQIRHDLAGYYACTAEEAEHEDAGNNSVGFDGRNHFANVENAARACCEENDIEPYQREIFEHWIVDRWFAEKLEAKGERVDYDFTGLVIWGRTCTGQAIFLDHVVGEIWRDLYGIKE